MARAADPAAQLAYRARVLDDRARARRRLGRPGFRAARGAVVDNDSGLPPAKRSRVSVDFDRWCQYHAWAQCAGCGLMRPRDLTQATLTRDQKVHVSEKSCMWCRGDRAHPVVGPDDVPPELRGLAPETARALSPLEIDVGPLVRAQHHAGYRQHATMMRFRWQPQSVEATLCELTEPEERRKGRRAYRFLRRQVDSAYRDFDDEHQRFLAEHPSADDRIRRRRLQFLERVGLEVRALAVPLLAYSHDILARARD